MPVEFFKRKDAWHIYDYLGLTQSSKNRNGGKYVTCLCICSLLHFVYWHFYRNLIFLFKTAIHDFYWSTPNPILTNVSLTACFLKKTLIQGLINKKNKNPLLLNNILRERLNCSLSWTQCEDVILLGFNCDARKNQRKCFGSVLKKYISFINVRQAYR